MTRTLTNDQRQAILPLIEEVERTEKPDRDLDARLACAAWLPQYRPARDGDHGESRNVGYIFVPTGFLMAWRYTSRLDDRLPGENITRVELRRDGGDGPTYWEATHHCANGVSVTGRGHAEAIARRAAALRGLLIDAGAP